MPLCVLCLCIAGHFVHYAYVLQVTLCTMPMCCRSLCVLCLCVAGHFVYYACVLQVTLYTMPMCCRSLYVLCLCVAGHFVYYAYGMVCLYNSDYQSVGGFDLSREGWGGEDVELFTKHAKSKLNVSVRVRVIQPGLGLIALFSYNYLFNY